MYLEKYLAVVNTDRVFQLLGTADAPAAEPYMR
jgi:hypothetical protein